MHVKMRDLKRAACSALALLMCFQLAQPALAAVSDDVQIGPDGVYVNGVYAGTEEEYRNGLSGAGQIGEEASDGAPTPPEDNESGGQTAEMSGRLDKNVSWELNLETRTLYITNDSETAKLVYTPDFDGSFDQPWNQWNSDITSVIIGDGIAAVGMYLLADMPALTEITVGNDVELFDLNCCQNDINLAAIHGMDLASAWAMGGPRAFGNTKIAAQFGSSEGQARGTCGENLVWSFDQAGHVLTVSGTGAMDDYDNFGPWYDYAAEIWTVIIDDGVTSVGANAFYMAPKLSGVQLANSVTYVGKHAFFNDKTIYLLRGHDWSDEYAEADAFNQIEYVGYTVEDRNTMLIDDEDEHVHSYSDLRQFQGEWDTCGCSKTLRYQSGTIDLTVAYSDGTSTKVSWRPKYGTATATCGGQASGGGTTIQPCPYVGHGCKQVFTHYNVCGCGDMYFTYHEIMPCPCGEGSTNEYAPSDSADSDGAISPGAGKPGASVDHVCNYTFTCIDLDTHLAKCDECGEEFVLPHIWDVDNHYSKCYECGAERIKMYVVSRLQQTGEGEGVNHYIYDVNKLGDKWYLKDGTPTTTGIWHSTATVSDILGSNPSYANFHFVDAMSRTSKVVDMQHTAHAALDDPRIETFDKSTDVVDNDGAGHVSSRLVDNNSQRLTVTWDRDNYTVSFDVDTNAQGNYVKPINDQIVLHNGVVRVPTAPTLNNYYFGGWYTDAACTNPYVFTSPVNSSFMLYAKWIPRSDTIYKVEYCLENGKGEWPVFETLVYRGVTDETATATELTYPGYVLDLGHDGTVREARIVNNDSGDDYTVLRLFYNKATFTVEFDSNGGTPAEINDQVIKYEDTAVEPTLSYPGYVLSYWEALGESSGMTYTYDFSEPVRENLKLKAVWAPEGDHPYEIRYEVQGTDGQFHLDYSATLYGTVNETVRIPTRTYPGVTLNMGLSRLEGVIPETGTVTLVARYSRDRYAIKFDLNGADEPETVPDQNLYYGELAVNPLPKKAGYHIIRWEAVTDNNAVFEYDWTAPVTQNLTLKPIWAADGDRIYVTKYWVMDQNGQYVLDKTVTGHANVDEHVHGDVLSYDGCYFDTEYEGNTPNGIIPVDGELVLDLYYTRYQYTVKFDANGGELAENSSLDDQVIYHGNKAVEPVLAIPGYALAKWTAVDESGSEFDWDYMNPVTENLTLKAVWSPEEAHEYQVNYWVQDQNGVYEIRDSQNLTSTVGKTVIADMRTYEGAYVDKGHENYKESGVIPATGKLVLDVYYTRYQYTVKFDANGGNLDSGSLSDQTIYHGNKAVKPELSIPGYVLYKWVAVGANGSVFDWDYETPITENLTLKAMWTPEDAHAYQVNYWVQNQAGIYEIRDSQNLAETVGETVSADIRTYEGVYLDDSHDGYLDAGVIPAAGKLVLDLYYTRYQYTVKFDANGGKLVDSSSLADQVIFYGNKAVEPKLEIAGYVLTGWKAVDANGSEFDWSYANQITEDLTLKAIWVPADDISYRVEYWLMNKDGKTYSLEQELTGKGHTDEVIKAELLQYKGFHLNDEIAGTKLSGSIPADGVLTLALYYDRDVFNITMDPRNGEPVKMLTVLYDCLVPEWNPTRFSWVFLGWMSGNAVYDMAAPVTNDLVLTAKWTDQMKIVIGDCTVYMTDTATITERDGDYLIENAAMIDVGENVVINQSRFEKTIISKNNYEVTTDAPMTVHIERDLDFNCVGGTVSSDRSQVTLDGKVTVNDFTVTNAKNSVLHVDSDALIDALPGTTIVYGPKNVTTVLTTGMPIDLRDGFARVPAGGRLIRNNVDMHFPTGSLVDLKTGSVTMNADDTIVIDPEGPGQVVITPPDDGGMIIIPGGDEPGATVPGGAEITIGGVTIGPDSSVTVDKDNGDIIIDEDGNLVMKSDNFDDVMIGLFSAWARSVQPRAGQNAVEVKFSLKKGDVLHTANGHVTLQMNGEQIITFTVYNQGGSVKEIVTVSGSMSLIDITKSTCSWETDNSGLTNVTAAYTGLASWNLKNSGGMTMAANGDITGEDMSVVRTGSDNLSPQNMVTKLADILDIAGLTSSGETRVTDAHNRVTVGEIGLHVNQDGSIENFDGTVITKQETSDSDGNSGVEIVITSQNGGRTVVFTTGDYEIDENTQPEVVYTDTTNGGYTLITHSNDSDPAAAWSVWTENSKTETLPDGGSEIKDPGESGKSKFENAKGWLESTGVMSIGAAGNAASEKAGTVKAHGVDSSSRIVDVVNHGGDVTLGADGAVIAQDGTGTIRTEKGSSITVTRNDLDGTEFVLTGTDSKVDVADDGGIQASSGQIHVSRESVDKAGLPVHTEIDGNGSKITLDVAGNVLTDNTDGSSEISVDKTDGKGDRIQSEVSNSGGQTVTDKSGNTVITGGESGIKTQTIDDKHQLVQSEIKRSGGSAHVDENGNVSCYDGGRTSVITDKTDNKNDPAHTEISNQDGAVRTDYNGQTWVNGGNSVIKTETIGSDQKPVKSEISNSKGSVVTNGSGNTQTENPENGRTEIVTDKTDKNGNPVHTEASIDSGRSETDYDGNTKLSGGNIVIETDTTSDDKKPVHSEIKSDGEVEIDGEGNTSTDTTDGGETVIKTDFNGIKTEIKHSNGTTETDYNGRTVTDGDTDIVITDKDGNETDVNVKAPGTADTDGRGVVDTTGNTIVIDPDGNQTELPNGGHIEAPDGVAAPGGVIDMTDGSEVRYPNGTEFYPDGSLSAGKAIRIIRPDGTYIYLKDGGIVHPDGNIEPAESVEISYPNGMKLNVSTGVSKIDPVDTMTSNGNIDVKMADGRHVDLPDGGVIHKNGTVEVKDDEAIKITYTSGKVIDLPVGGKLNANGSLDIDKDQNVTVGGTVITLPKTGGSLTVTGAANVLVPNGGHAVDKKDKEYKLTWGGSVDNPSGKVTANPDPNAGESEAPEGSYMIYRDTAMQGGSMYVSHSYAEPGTQITVVIDPAKGYTVNKLTAVRVKNNVPVTVTRFGNTMTFTFKMPEADVRVAAAFVKTETSADEKEFTITKDSRYTGGTISVNKTKANPGMMVTITASPSNAYHLSRLSVVRTDDGSVVPLTRVGTSWQFTFIMPASNVRLNGLFSQGASTGTGTGTGIGSDGTFNGSDTTITDPNTPLAGHFYGLTDVRPTDWYYTWMANAIYRGYIDAQGKSSINADGIVSRKEAAFTIKRLVNGQASYSSNTAIKHYNDVSVNTKYSGEIAYNLDMGYMVGTSPVAFSPEQNLTREQFALILYRIFGRYFVNTSHKSLTQFADGKGVSDWALDAVQWAVDNNLLIGDGNYLAPQRGVTRAEMATLVMRIALVMEYKNINSIAAVKAVSGVPTPPSIDTSALKLGELTVRAY